MNHPKWVSRFIFSGFLLVVLMGPNPAMAKDCEPWMARAVSVQGNVQVQRAGASTWENIKFEDRFCPGDMVRILEKSRAALVLRNESVIRLNENTTITIVAEEKPGALLLRMIKGAVHFFSRVPRSLNVVTPFLNCAVEGTEFFVRVEASRAYFSVFRGRVRTFNDRGELLLADGQTAIAAKEQAPSVIAIARPRDAVNWSLYYPSIGTPEGSGTEKDLYSASQLLQTGQVTEAQDILTRVLNKEPGNSDALALNAIIALTLHRKEEARELAEKTVANDPTSSSAKLALAYVQQAFFNVEAARATMQSAVADNPENALVWARLSELWLATGYLDNALSAAEKAVALSPDISRTQTVLGYAHISQIKIQKAKEAFQKAITFDQADPLPRLGLGLALIREGELKAGRAQIEIAAGLDPGNALVRSYLGKAFYEEKKDDLAGRQYAVAKELDPNDPTPYFYDAIAKQTTNRPVEALHDLQKAVKLNDNRAVYRSKLMLDADEASRSASLARIYSDLGFQQRALVEGWQSVNADPNNFSAHRFLADSYVVRPRHEIARVSELLQSQLLQPLNSTPIQTRMAESDLFLVSASGPERISFNEFNPLFNRNRTVGLVSGLAGENDTYAGEGVVSSIYNRLSLSAGYSYFQSDGWQENTDQNDDIANIFGQYEISHKTSIQAEYRYRNSERGDLSQLFFEDNFAPNLRFNDKVNQGRLGFHHAFSPGSDLIGNFQYADADRFSRDFDERVTRYDIETKEESYGGELSYLLRSHHFNFIAGGGYYNVKKDDATFIDLLGEPYFNKIVDNGVDHANLYLYSHIKPANNLTITVGASGDKLDPEDETVKVKRDQFNPKLGVSWHPFTGTTLRGAAFRVLKRTLIADQTIEPTQVAGFNQFFDESNGTDYWVYGGAIDQQFTQSMFGGLEFTYRDLTIPVFLTATGTEEFDWEEYLVRAYLFWAPRAWLSFSAEYLFEGLEREEDFSDGAKEADTHRVPLGINFFHHSGLSASLKGNFVDQRGIFENFDIGEFQKGNDDFFLLDFAISYRLPKRYGFVSIGVNNLTDESFQYFNSDEDNLLFQPNRVLFCKITIAFP